MATKVINPRSGRTGILVERLADGFVVMANGKKAIWKNGVFVKPQPKFDSKTLDHPITRLSDPERFRFELDNSLSPVGDDFCALLFLPHVMYEVAWEHTLSIADIGTQQNVSELKSLTRSIRRLEREMKSDRGRYIRSENTKRIGTGSDVVHSAISGQSSYIGRRVRNVIKKHMPTTNDDMVELYVAVVLARIVLLATLRYCRWVDSRLIAEYKFPAKSSIIPAQIAEVSVIIKNKFKEFFTLVDDAMISNETNVILSKLKDARFAYSIDGEDTYIITDILL